MQVVYSSIVLNNSAFESSTAQITWTVWEDEEEEKRGEACRVIYAAHPTDCYFTAQLPVTESEEALLLVYLHCLPCELIEQFPIEYQFCQSCRYTVGWLRDKFITVSREKYLFTHLLHSHFHNCRWDSRSSSRRSTTRANDTSCWWAATI